MYAMTSGQSIFDPLLTEMQAVSTIFEGAITTLNNEIIKGRIKHGNRSIVPVYLALFERFVSDTLEGKTGEEKENLQAAIAKGTYVAFKDKIPKETIIKYFIGGH